jgi:hypothetical protein
VSFLQWVLAAMGAGMAAVGLLVTVWAVSFVAGRAFTLGRLAAARKWNEMRRKNGRNRP